ncbi:hypothetical protein BB559_006617 [Furculomyces boomerangus]|uniref:tRNA-uridine aminocarboxypropyltransferase 1 n=1 Tax=Furculomyces boomerangus TaxID=61424 RepID=A0A2T9Y1N0_9FUNG|nr:hypothetical protein BB559_006617 [Furculomyces boomerangus]
MDDIAEYDLESIPTFPDSILDSFSERFSCPNCKKQIKFFCYRCYYVPLDLKTLLPSIDLPLHLHIFKHFQELDGKSTAIHAKIVADKSVTIHKYPSQEPISLDPKKCLLLYPGPDAKTMEELSIEGTLDNFTDIIVIDGTWKQARGMICSESRPEHMRKHSVLQKNLLLNAQKLSIKPRKTKFWRYQNNGPSHLATIEAIYFMFYEYLLTKPNPDYQQIQNIGNLMFFYKHFFNLIQNHYNSDKSKAYTSRHSTDYIKYNKS